MKERCQKDQFIPIERPRGVCSSFVAPELSNLLNRIQFMRSSYIKCYVLKAETLLGAVCASLFRAGAGSAQGSARAPPGMARVALLTFVLVALLLSARAQLQDPGCPGLPTPCGGLARGVCFAANASAPPTCKCTAGWTGAYSWIANP